MARDNLTALCLAAYEAMRTGNVVRVERKPRYGIESEFLDPGVRARTQPMHIEYRKDGTKESQPIAPGSILHCAMNAKSESQVKAIVSQWVSGRGSK